MVSLFCCGWRCWRLGSGEAEGVAEGEGFGGCSRACLFKDFEEVAADGDRDSGFGGLVVVRSCAAEDELASTAAEGVIAGDFEELGRLAVGGFRVDGGCGVEGDVVRLFDDLGGTVIVDVVPELGVG
jgi:hypothetical protein